MYASELRYQDVTHYAMAKQAEARKISQQAQEAAIQYERGMEALSTMIDLHAQQTAALVYGGILNPNFCRPATP